MSFDFSWMQILLLSGIFLCGSIVGWNVHSKVYSDALNELLEELEDDPIPITVKLENDIFYVYTKDKGDFLTQGATEDEVVENLIKTFPDKKFVIDKETMKVFNAKSV